MDRRFEAKVVMVSGAATGLGYAAALRLAQEGAHLSLLDVDAGGIGRAREQIVEAVPSAEVLAIAADVAQEQDVGQSIADTLARFGRTDGLYNNAGIEGGQNPLGEYATEALDRVLAINLKGVFFGMKRALPHMKAQGSGAIVNAASVGGIREFGVRVNAIAPGRS